MYDPKELESIGERDTPRIDKVSRLEVRFESPGTESKRIYANGRMQVRVWVFIEAVDADGENVPLAHYPDLITAKLIRYHDGAPLERELYTGKPLANWNSSGFENKYIHEMPEGVQSSGSTGGATGEPIEFWVSSSVEGQAQIAAEVTLQGKVYRSNNTVNPDARKINKSIVIHAVRNFSFSPDQFTWQSQRIEGSFNGDQLYRYHLGLYPGAKQIKLLDWESNQYGANDKYPVTFCDTGLILGRDAPRSFKGVIAPVRFKEVDIYVSRLHQVDQRSGELTAVKGVPPKYTYSGDEVRVLPFYFTVIDEYGNTHDLSLAVDIPNDEFLLQRG
jgi:hypothetical protein